MSKSKRRKYDCGDDDLVDLESLDLEEAERLLPGLSEYAEKLAQYAPVDPDDGLLPMLYPSGGCVVVPGDLSDEPGGPLHEEER